MQSGFVLFGPLHLEILASVIMIAAVMAFAVRQRPSFGPPLAIALSAALVINELSLYVYKAQHHWFQFPHGMPLQLCDLAVWVAAAALLVRRGLVFECAYYFGLAGTLQALLTPDLREPFPSFSTVNFFLSHGLVVIAALYLVWSGIARPLPGSVWRAFAALNAWTAFVGLFNAIFHTNYMYLCAKPGNASLLDRLGPWPVYVIAGDLLALALFTLLWLPFRPSER